MKKIFLAAIILFVSLAAFPFTNYASNDTTKDIILYMGQVKILPVSHPSRIVIANPEVVDVNNVSISQLTLSAKAVGTTSLVFWDNFGEQSFQVKVFSENMQNIKFRIDNILSKLGLTDVVAQAEDAEAKVLLLGSVKTAEERERVMTALGALKDKIVDLLLIKELESTVEIDVQVLELDKDATNTLGFTWPASITGTDVSLPVSTAVTGLKNLFYVSKFTRSAFNVTLDVLVQEGKVRILSRPRLACQSGKEAELLVGGEKPIFTTTVAATTGAEGTEVEYKEFGIKLKIKPTVTDDNRIKLGLNVEVSEVGTADTIGTAAAPTAKAYPLSKRSTSTQLYLNNGQTMAISGLIKEKMEEDIRRVPFLSDIPFFGGAFRRKTTTIGGGTGQRGNTELFIMLTPTIVSTQKDVEQEQAMKKASQEDKTNVKSTATISSQPVIMPTPLQDYASFIQRRILDNLTYPPSAKEAGFQGTVKLSLHLAYLGELLDAGVKSSSGYKVLDDNAISAARAITKYPPFPSSIEKKEIWIDIPVDYRLE